MSENGNNSKNGNQSKNNSNNLNDSFKETPNYYNYTDKDIDKEIDNFYKAMNSFYSQEKQIGDFNNSTQSKVMKLKIVVQTKIIKKIITIILSYDINLYIFKRDIKYNNLLKN